MSMDQQEGKKHVKDEIGADFLLTPKFNFPFKVNKNWFPRFLSNLNGFILHTPFFARNEIN